MEVNCLNCDFFQPADTPGAGWCRRNPPAGIDAKTNPNPPGEPLDIWPPIADGAIERCGEFRINSLL